MAQKVDISTFLLNNLKQNFPSNYLKKFGSLKTNVERVNLVYTDLLENCPDYPPFIKDEKNDEKAVVIRETGNMFFRSGKYREAQQHYTDSILKAKSDEVLSLAYANRSAALYKQNRFKECLMDIERALFHGYPDELKPKLIERQRRAKAQKTVDEKYYEEVTKIPQSKKNPLIECAADNVKIVTTQQYGRGVIATRDIKIGEIIAIEKPYTSHVGEKEMYVHCHECLELCYNMIPCNTCTQSLYCSVECRDQAFNYHQYECSIQLSLDSLFQDKIKIQLPLDSFQEKPKIRVALKILFLSKNELKESDSYEVEENEIYRSDRFKEVHNMEGHIEQRDDMNLFHWTAVTAGIFHLIKNHTSFLQDGVNEDCVKHFLLSLNLICCTNTFEVEKVIQHQTSYGLTTSVGIGVYPFFTLMNHSCWPNVICQCHGNTMVMRAINTIKKGEQCFVCYGPHYLTDSKEYRQNFFAENYFFKCTCRACEGNWPMNDVSDTHCDCDLEWFLTMTKLSSGDMNAVKEELPLLLSKARVLENNVSPGRDYGIKNRLASCYNLFGNKMRIN